MISEEDEPNYAFWDYLYRGLEGGNSRDSIEYQWHKESQTPSQSEYNPDESQIDFQGPTYDEINSK